MKTSMTEVFKKSGKTLSETTNGKKEPNAGGDKETEKVAEAPGDAQQFNTADMGAVGLVKELIPRLSGEPEAKALLSVAALIDKGGKKAQVMKAWMQFLTAYTQANSYRVD